MVKWASMGSPPNLSNMIPYLKLSDIRRSSHICYIFKSYLFSEDLDDFEKELELLNAALDAAPVTPTETTTRTPKEDDILFDDEDMFADIEEILNEERRNL